MNDELLREIIKDLRADNKSLREQNNSLHAVLMAYRSENTVVQATVGKELVTHMRHDAAQDDVEQRVAEHRITKAAQLS